MNGKKKDRKFTTIGVASRHLIMARAIREEMGIPISQQIEIGLDLYFKKLRARPEAVAD